MAPKLVYRVKVDVLNVHHFSALVPNALRDGLLSQTTLNSAINVTTLLAISTIRQSV